MTGGQDYRWLCRNNDFGILIMRKSGALDESKQMKKADIFLNDPSDMWKLDSCGRAKVEARRLVNDSVTILG